MGYQVNYGWIVGTGIVIGLGSLYYMQRQDIKEARSEGTEEPEPAKKTGITLDTLG